MATRSFVGVQVGDNLFKGVYVHNNGDPLLIGKMLLRHYSDKDKLLSIIEKGDFSTLRENPEEISYYGDSTSRAKTHTFDPYAKNYGLNVDWEYAYIFTSFNQWLVAKRDVIEGYANSMTSVERAICDDSAFLLLDLEREVKGIDFHLVPKHCYSYSFEGAKAETFSFGRAVNCEMIYYDTERKTRAGRPVTVYELAELNYGALDYFLVAVSENSNINVNDIMCADPNHPYKKGFIRKILQRGGELKDLERELVSNVLFLKEGDLALGRNLKGTGEPTKKWYKDVAELVACRKDRSCSEYIALKGSFSTCMVVRIDSYSSFSN